MKLTAPMRSAFIKFLKVNEFEIRDKVNLERNNSQEELLARVREEPEVSNAIRDYAELVSRAEALRAEANKIAHRLNILGLSPHGKLLSYVTPEQRVSLGISKLKTGRMVFHEAIYTASVVQSVAELDEIRRTLGI